MQLLTGITQTDHQPESLCGVESSVRYPGDLGVVWERQKQETGWRSWGRGPMYTRKTSFLAIHRIFPSHDGAFATRRGNAGTVGAADKTVWLPWIKLEKPDARLIRPLKRTITGRLILPTMATKTRCKAVGMVVSAG